MDKFSVKKAKNNAIVRFLPLFTVLVIVVFWQVLSSIISLEIILPSPYITLKEFLNSFLDKEFYASCLTTALRAIICYIFSYILGSGLGYLAYKSQSFKRAFLPIISLFRSIPTMSIILLILLWVNYDIAPIIIAFIVVFPLSYSSSLSGYESLDSNIFNMAKVYNLSDKVMFKNYIFPTLIENFYNTSVSELLLCFKIVISGEVMAETAKGLGALIKLSKYSLETGKLFAYTITAVIIGVLLELALKGIIKIFIKRRKVW